MFKRIILRSAITDIATVIATAGLLIGPFPGTAVTDFILRLRTAGQTAGLGSNDCLVYCENYLIYLHIYL
jgi:hypothetical protein